MYCCKIKVLNASLLSQYFQAFNLKVVISFCFATTKKWRSSWLNSSPQNVSFLYVRATQCFQKVNTKTKQRKTKCFWFIFCSLFSGAPAKFWFGQHGGSKTFGLINVKIRRIKIWLASIFYRKYLWIEGMETKMKRTRLPVQRHKKLGEAKTTTESKCNQIYIRSFAVRKHEKIVSVHHMTKHEMARTPLRYVAALDKPEWRYDTCVQGRVQETMENNFWKKFLQVLTLK